jgi:hypothetical protein
MVGPWPHRAFGFRALSKRCDVCRRYARLKLAGLHDVDYRTKTISCSACGSEAYFCFVEPIKEFRMHDYRLDEVETPERHPDAIKRIRIASSDGIVEGHERQPSDVAARVCQTLDEAAADQIW